MPETVLVQPTQNILQMPTYVFAWLDELKAEARQQGKSYIDLGIGSPNLPIPDMVLEAIKAEFTGAQQSAYPPFKATEHFRQAVVDWMKRRYGATFDPETEVLALSGSKEGLAQLTIAYIDKGDLSIVPDIYYPVHSRATWLVGGEVFHVPLRAENEFLPDLSDIPADVARRAKLFFVNYPNNPTGAVASMGFYKDLVAFCQEYQLVLVSDMAYGELTYDGYRAPSVFEVDGAKDVAIEFHSFSKTFSMAGCRLGFAVGHPEIIKALYATRTNMGYGTPRAIQQGGAVALNHAESFIPETLKAYEARRAVITQGFRKLGWSVELFPATMYAWLPVPSGYTSEAWTRKCLDEAGVVVTPGHAFGQGGEGYFRMSLVVDEATLSQAISALEKAGIRYS